MTDHNSEHSNSGPSQPGPVGGGFLEGFASLVERLGDLAEKSEQLRKSGDLETNDGKIRTSYNFTFGGATPGGGASGGSGRGMGGRGVRNGGATEFDVKPTRKKKQSAGNNGPAHSNPAADGNGDVDETPASAHRSSGYARVGGMGAQLQRVRELIELPLNHPEIFRTLGIDAPKGVLLHGPPGCGKTLIARTIAEEAEANFFTISGPEVIHKFYGESEAHLRKIFQEAAKSAPSIIFIDEIDAIAPKRENAAGDVERRVVAQLLALMDGLDARENVVVIAATNLPNALDPALRRPGRFDREIEILIPDRTARREILGIHTRNMPLADDVDLDELAQHTHGFVGADLAALCRETAMACLRRLVDELDFSGGALNQQQLAKIGVTMADFQHGRKAVEPSAIREVFVEVPAVNWNDIGGLEDIKQELRETVVWPLEHADLFRSLNTKPAKGLLLAGPPGCGKTMLARAVATECGVNFISIKGPELFSKFIGESEKAIRDVFRKARQAAPCIIFFDEIDGMAANRADESGDSGVAQRVLSQLLSELDGVEELTGVFVLAATNRPEAVDAALKRYGRFERTIQIGLPDQASRLEILRTQFRDKPLDPAVDLQELAARAENLSGADLAALASRAARNAIRRKVSGAVSPSGDELVISSDDVAEAFAPHVGRIQADEPHLSTSDEN
ncbi:AAA family ATPase [Planctomycetaceae bacterium SH139]